MEFNTMLNLSRAYYDLSSLQLKENTGKHCVLENRYESCADAIYGAQQWAWLIWSQSNTTVHIHRVIAMLSVSELAQINPAVDFGFTRNPWKANMIYELRDEFVAGVTEEARFAKMCKELNNYHINNDNYNVFFYGDWGKEVVRVYTTLEHLKSQMRQGFVNWNVTGIRCQSIAEHVYCVQQLAWLMWLCTDLDVDIFKVIAMLSMHEAEETIIGDLTPVSKISAEEKLRMGNEAVEKLLGNLKKYEFFKSYLDEFNAEETINAFFAHLCDKLDCDMTIKNYSDRGFCSISNALRVVLDNPKIQKLIADGAKTVADGFIMADRPMYYVSVEFVDFADILEFINVTDVTKL